MVNAFRAKDNQLYRTTSDRSTLVNSVHRVKRVLIY